MSDDRAMEDVLRRYALGALSGAQLEEAEARAMTDDDFAESLEAIEVELADEYVAGALTASEHALFAERLRRSATLRARVAAARTLAEVAVRRRPNAPVASAPATASVKRDRAPWNWLLAAAAGAAIITAGLWMTRVVPSPPAQTPAISTPPVPPPAAANTPSGVTTPSASTTPGRAPAPIATIALFGAVVRDETAVPTFAVGDGSGVVRVEIHLDAADAHPSYDLSIETGSGQQVAAQPALTASRDAGGLVVSMLVPAERIPPGRYAARITGRRASTATLIAVYPFRSTR